jgi:hypothetical protein
MFEAIEKKVRPRRVIIALGAIGLTSAIASWTTTNTTESEMTLKPQAESEAVLIGPSNELPGLYYGDFGLLKELSENDKNSAIKNINLAYEQLKLSYPKWFKDSAQTKALVDLWMNESGWQQDADNDSSDAYGIPQAILSEENIDAGYFIGYSDYKKSADVQIAWGLYYISEIYKKPSAAWQHWQDNGWY